MAAQRGAGASLSLLSGPCETRPKERKRAPAHLFRQEPAQLRTALLVPARHQLQRPRQAEPQVRRHPPAAAAAAPFRRGQS